MHERGANRVKQMAEKRNLIFILLRGVVTFTRQHFAKWVISESISLLPVPLQWAQLFFFEAFFLLEGGGNQTSEGNGAP